MPTLAALFLSVLLASATTEEVEQAVRTTYDGGGYQTAHPRPEGPDSFSLPEIPDALVTILEALLWTGVAVVLVLIVLAVVRRLRGRDAKDAVRPNASVTPAPPPGLDAPLGDAEALARQGRYGEAAHVLLLRTIAALGRHQRVGPSLTSREILGRLQLAPGSHDALGRLVRVVEVSLFGGRAAAQEDYEACVRAFEALRTSLGAEAS